MPAAAPLTVFAVIKIVLWIVAIIIAIAFLWDIAMKLWIWLAKPPCKLHKHLLMADECAGACPLGSVCVATATKPYFWGAFGVQDAACTCGLPGSGAAGGTGAPPTGTGSSQIKKVKKDLQPADKHTEDTNKAIDEAGE